MTTESIEFRTGTYKHAVETSQVQIVIGNNSNVSWKRLRNAALVDDVSAARLVYSEIESSLSCFPFAVDGHVQMALHYASDLFSAGVSVFA